MGFSVRRANYGFALTLGIGMLLLALPGCSSTAGSSPTRSSGQVNTPTVTATAGIPSPIASPTGANGADCQTTQLTLSLHGQQSGASNFANIYRLENTSQHTCTLEGYPGVQLLTASQQPLTITISQQTSAYLYTSQQPHLVTLAPAASAYFILEWNAAVNGSGNCPGAAFVLVTPPGDQATLRLAGMVEVCTGSVIVSPLEATAFGY